MVSSIDRLSGMPDDVICHILSFLPTQRSIATSILSKRWRFLWARVPVLDFDDGEYDDRRTRLLDFINKVMLLHKGHLKTFRLYMEGCSDCEFGKWIATVIARNVRNLDICLSHNQVMSPQIPQCILTCKTLVGLRLIACGGIPMTGTVYLPVLKKLHLILVEFESLPHLLSGCPVLEELIIDKDYPLNVVVCSPTLNRLKLNSRSCYSWNKPCGVKLHTPAIRYLQLHDFKSENISAGALTYLTEADVVFNAPKERSEEVDGERDILYSHSVLEFVGKLYNVKCLKLSTRQMEVPNAAFSDLTMKFHNLTKLELRADGRFISKFLENADNLQVLTIWMVNTHLMGDWIEPYRQVPKCLSSHLRTITIRQFGCADHECNMVGYLLRNAKVLKRMEVYSASPRNKFETLHRLSLFPRGSEACELAFY